MGWNRDDWALAAKLFVFGCPVAVGIGSGLAVYDNVLPAPDPPTVVSSPPPTSSKAPGYTLPNIVLVIPTPETRIKTETQTMPRHAAPEVPSTIPPAPNNPVPGSTSRSPQPRPRATTAPPVVTTTPPPATTTVTPTPEPEIVEQRVVEPTPTPEVTVEPTEFQLDPVYQRLVQDFISRDPLGSVFLETRRA